MRQDAPSHLVSHALWPVRMAPELNARGPRLSCDEKARIPELPVLPNADLCEAAEQSALANVASSFNCLLVDLTKVHLNRAWKRGGNRTGVLDAPPPLLQSHRLPHISARGNDSAPPAFGSCAVVRE